MQAVIGGQSADDDDEDEDQVRDRRHGLQLLPVHSTRAAVLVRHVRSHRRAHSVAVRVATCRKHSDAGHRRLHRVHHHLLAGVKRALRRPTEPWLISTILLYVGQTTVRSNFIDEV